LLFVALARKTYNCTREYSSDFIVKVQGMIRLILANLLSLTIMVSSSLADSFIPAPPLTQARSYIVVDQQSQHIIAAQQPALRIEPASLTKLMTAYLTFKAIKDNQLKLDQLLTVSEKGWKTEGSRMFLDLRKPATVHELIHGMIIQSGNDACITLAEAIAGSEEVFAQLMNREAKRLLMHHTHFINATGLPDENHYTTASDLALLAQALLRDFPDFYPLYSIKTYTYNNIKQPNRNLLLYRDPEVDGMKTGHTDSAGYCLVASSKRNGRRLISVVTGEPSEIARTNDSASLLNYAAQFFDTLKLFSAQQIIAPVTVYKATHREVNAGFLQDIYLTIAKGQANKITHQFIAKEKLIAPIAQGSVIGKMIVSLEGKPIREFPVVALQQIEEGGFFRRLWDSIRLWFA
jgi:D-alanyl-D-alanine carboxypeptidase (penicillin-binding protein 5/6)